MTMPAVKFEAKTELPKEKLQLAAPVTPSKIFQEKYQSSVFCS